MLRSSHDACGCSTQTTSTINLKRSTLHPHEGQADRPNTPSDSVNLGSNPVCSIEAPPHTRGRTHCLPEWKFTHRKLLAEWTGIVKTAKMVGLGTGTVHRPTQAMEAAP